MTECCTSEEITCASCWSKKNDYTNQHKDRYSALAMAVRYIAELEERKRKLLQPMSAVIGVVSRF